MTLSVMVQYIDPMLSDKEIFTKWLKKKIKGEEAMKGKVLARRIGVHPSTISGWFSGKSKGPAKDVRLEICKIFNVKHNDIVKKPKNKKNKAAEHTSPPSPTDLAMERHRQLLEKFKQKDLALQINQLLVEIEEIDMETLKNAVPVLKLLKTYALEEASKKRNVSNEKE